MTHPPLEPGHDQSAHQLRLEWGPTGARAVTAGADVAVVVDVLSFTTAVTVAVGRGARVLPFAWKDERAAAYAEEQDAVLAVGRLEALARPGLVSLSAAAMLESPVPPRLVLPSPNGSTISAALAGAGATVVATSLRNRAAVGAWLAPRLAAGQTVAVVPAGERWPDGSLRPCAEDLWGAGAVLAALVDAGLDEGRWSPEARLARRAFASVVDDLPDQLAACASGVELHAKGFDADVAVAAEVDADDVVPVLEDGGFVARFPG